MTDGAVPAQAAIEALFDVMNEGWAKGDGVLFASVFGDDADFVNIRAQGMGGRTEIAEHQSRLFSSVYAET